MSVDEDRFRERLKMCNPRAGYLLNFVEAPEVHETLPALVEIPFVYHDSVDLKLEKVQEHLHGVFNNLNVSKVESEKIEKLTRGQVGNDLWVEAREVRITKFQLWFGN